MFVDFKPTPQKEIAELKGFGGSMAS